MSTKSDELIQPEKGLVSLREILTVRLTVQIIFVCPCQKLRTCKIKSRRCFKRLMIKVVLVSLENWLKLSDLI